MNRQTNVISIDAAAAKQGGRGADSFQVVGDMGTKSAALLQGLLRDLFDRVDDVFFELADKAGSNRDQVSYFDAMRDIRMQRKEVVQNYLKNIIRAFTNFGKPVDASKAKPDIATQELSLVENDQLEVTVAVESMIHRVRSGCAEQLACLEVRFSSLLSDPEAKNEADYPLSPERVCNGFVASCETLEIPQESRLVLFKLFERTVLAKLNGVYFQANNYLKQKGVLPDLNKVTEAIRQHYAQYPGSVPMVASPAAAQSASNNTDETNLAPSAPVNHAVGNHSAGGPFSPNSRVDSLVADYLGHSSMGMGAPGVNHLIAGLTNLQQNAVSLPAGDAYGLLDYRSLVASAMAKAGASTQQKMLDDHLLNLVEMLFEFIFSDRQLQPEMKTIVGRLQVPILKVAILDRRFFSDSNHPARKLLNAIAKSAIGWTPRNDDKRDSFRDKVESIVGYLVRDFKDDVAIFDEALDDFSRFIDVEARRGQLIEQRLRDAEEGQAQNENARYAARRQIEKVTAGKDLPADVEELLNAGWVNVLTLSWLKYGSESEQWKQACQTAHQLVWSVFPDAGDPDGRRRLLQTIPGLLKGLRAGLNEAGFDKVRMSKLLRALENHHVSALQSFENTRKAMVEQDDEPTILVDELQTEELLEASLEVVTSTPESTEVEMLAAQPVLSDSEAECNVEKVVVSDLQPDTTADALIVSVSPVTVEPTDTRLADESEEPVATVSTAPSEKVLSELVLNVGSWLEVVSDSTGVPQRLKVAAIIRATGKHILVNRSGMKVMTLMTEELLSAISKGTIQVLENSPVFDRALESIIGGLRGNH